ncbi:MAG: AAA family ATPase [Candidatus Hydrogenedentes bacterium]|nr:AAA family ATPase [Candidatus Hydrogenedentota bacterium]
MRFTSVWLDGYGRFENRMLSLLPGLQIVCGPNEQGKSTVRHFLTDMLYGQRRNQLRTFDESNELRRPWKGASRYGGRLRYVLDDGREFEVQRDFDKKQGTVTIFDCKHMRDVTAEFPRLKNREANFAEEHLGLSKAVFVHVATIGPMSLDDLGDDDALGQIREKVVSLTDSSDESGTAERALRVLAERGTEIGRQVSHSKKPLPVARFRLDALDNELARARATAADIAATDAQRAAASGQLTLAKEQKQTLEAELRQIESRSRAQRFAEAQRLQARIDEATQSCFMLSSAREFPLEHTPDVQRAANAAATARAQFDRTLAEQAELAKQLREESELLDADGIPQAVDIPESTEQELVTLESKIVRLRERAEELGTELVKAQERFAQAQADLQLLPDFSRLGADPVAWLTQLAASFRVARQTRGAAIEKLRRVREEIQRRKQSGSGPASVFAEFTDFTAEARAYEVDARVYGERSVQLTQQIDEMEHDASDHQDRMPAYLGLAALLLGVALVCAAVAAWRELAFVFVPASLFGAASFLMLVRWSWSRHLIGDIARDLDRAREELAELDQKHLGHKQQMDAIIAKAGYTSLREMEALHERHLRDSSDLDMLAATEQQLAREAHEEAEQVAHLFGRVTESFQATGETVAHEDDIDSAAGRAIARYQEYRDAKRRLSESRDRPGQLQKQLADAQTALEQLQRDEVGRALALRQVLRDTGFREESRYTSVLTALQAYRVRTAQVREKLGRVAIMREREHSLAVRLDAEQRDHEKQTVALTKRLAAGGVDTVDKWHALAKQAELYRKAWDDRAGSQERLEGTLRGETLESLRAAVEKAGTGAGPLTRTEDEVKHDLERCLALIETLAAEEHYAHIQVTQRAAGQRSINEIEEEREATALRVAELELELEATALALSLIEEAARDRHARIAPRVAATAGQYLRRITDGAYDEVMVSRELNISVRIPQTAQITDDPRRRLSKGTVDQVYLALRLALVQTISASGERAPLLLDDPFANYDDARLANALALLAEAGQSHQILLFTCRDDVSRAAAQLSIPVMNL